MDSPNTTAATTYAVYIASVGGGVATWNPSLLAANIIVKEVYV